jgi:hypothetical protein
LLDVFITVDVEIWCDGWKEIDEKFPASFRKYIYGPTPRGHYGLPFQIDALNEHGLPGVFFVEPLFSTRFGPQPLQEIVQLINEGSQEVQLHLHTEWVDESKHKLLPDIQKKRQHLRYFSETEQTLLIAAGKTLLEKAGASDINAFRAGSFAFNADTMKALATNKITFDSSYNASMFGTDSGVFPGKIIVEPTEWECTQEIPMTVFNDGSSSLRHTQLTACSSRELEHLLWQALKEGRSSFVILSHSFELLNGSMTNRDNVVVKRFLRLCKFLDLHRDLFRVRGFKDLQPKPVLTQPEPLKSLRRHTGTRILEQAFRRIYQ